MDALSEAKLAQSELHASTYWTSNKNQPTSHLFKCDAHLKNLINLLSAPPTAETYGTGFYGTGTYGG